MNLFLVLPISLCLLFTIKTKASSIPQASLVCERFAAGKINALKTLEALDVNIDDYSIGANNTAKILCA